MNNAWWVKPEDLDDRQKAVIDLPLTSSHLILGPPGSGKTNLLLLRASQMVLSGKPNILIIVFTRTLKEFVVTGGHQYEFAADNITTLSNWTFRFLRDQGVKAPATDPDFDKQRVARLTQIKEVIATKNLGPIYDAIILDEAQDYLHEEIEIFLKMGRVVFAAADARQQIYALDNSNAATGLRDQFKPRIHELKHHYRNGAKICEIADELAKPWNGYPPLKPTSNYDENRYPSSVDIQSCRDLDDQVNKAVKLLVTQTKAYPDELLGVLCPNKAILRDAWRLIEASSIAAQAICQSSDDGYVAFESRVPICVSTIHSAKGLEFRAVHVVGAEAINKSPLNRHIAYTGFTRAKTSLSIYFTKKLPPYLESALNATKPPVKPAKLNQLFGRK